MMPLVAQQETPHNIARKGGFLINVEITTLQKRYVSISISSDPEVNLHVREDAI